MVRVALLGRCSGGVVCWTKGASSLLTVIVKATYAIAEEGPMAVVDPQPVFLQELHYDDQPTRGVSRPSDVAPFKPAADVLLVGHAYAPAGERVANSVVRLSLTRGPQVLVNKTLEVSGDRVDDVLQPFEKMPIVFERAWGGAGDAENPIGVGAESAEQPNVKYRERRESAACFGPISEWWPVRRARLGNTSRDAVTGESPNVPDDFDWSYFHHAPDDQRTGFLEGNEELSLDGLHPRRQHSTHQLPAARAVAAVFDLDGPRALVALEADTMFIEPDEGRVSVVWRGVAEVPASAQLDQVLVVAGVASDHAPVVLPASRSEVEEAAIVRDLATKSAPKSFDATVPIDPSPHGNGAPFEIAPATDSSASSDSDVPGSTPWAEAAGSEVPPPLEDLTETVSLTKEAVSAAAPFSLARPGDGATHTDNEGTPWGDDMPPVLEPIGDESTLALKAMGRGGDPQRVPPSAAAQPPEEGPAETSAKSSAETSAKSGEQDAEAPQEAGPPAVTKDGIPIRWATEDREPEAAPEPPSAPEDPPREAPVARMYASLAAFKAKKKLH